MDDLKRLATIAAVQKMMTQQWISVCTIDELAKMLGTVPDRDARQILSACHCVNFSEMAPALRNEIPALIARCLSVPLPTLQPAPVTPTPAPKRGLLSLIRSNRES